MSTFGERFNAWLIEQGKEPVSPEFVEALDAAAAETAQEIEGNRGPIVREIQEFMAGLTEAIKRARGRA